MLMTLSFSLFNGLIASWYSVMNITFRPLPLGDPQDVDWVIGHIGLFAIIANSVSTILVSAVVDRYLLCPLWIVSSGFFVRISLGCKWPSFDFDETGYQHVPD